MADIYVYNTLTHQKAPLTPAEPGRVSIYVCGITPYAPAHLGHARPAVIWDAIKRHLMRRGYIVRHVQNFTDIDDKLIVRAQQLNMSVSELAAQNVQGYLNAMRALKIDLPDAYPRVSENMDEIVSYIADLVANGSAYVAEGGDVYFDVARKADYGKLSRRALEAEEPGHRLTDGAGKRAAPDFALWKAARPGEPHWPSPWGEGRPGWHIECSAMAEHHLGEHIDLHGGGVDLVFPHHENEIAQTEAHLGHPMSTVFVHNGLVTVADAKMSKSLDNGILLDTLLERFPPAVLRTYLLSVHYRSPLAFEESRLHDWQRALEKVWAAYYLGKDVEPPGTWPKASWVDALLAFESGFLAAMDDDFNTPKALALVFDMVRLARPIIDQGGPDGDAAAYLVAKNLRHVDDLFRLLPDEREANGPDDGTERLLRGLLEARERARADKHYERADAIRQALSDVGWRVEDTPAGARLLPNEAND
jgi:cysteinyl-tRNA synthetase